MIGRDASQRVKARPLSMASVALSVGPVVSLATRGARPSRVSRLGRADGAILAVRRVAGRPAVSSSRASSSSAGSGAPTGGVGRGENFPKGARAKRFRRRPPPVACAEPAVTTQADTETTRANATPAGADDTAVATHICVDCGYLYVASTPFDAQRDDFACPQCDAPKSRFAAYDPASGKAIGAVAAAELAPSADDEEADGEVGNDEPGVGSPSGGKKGASSNAAGRRGGGGGGGWE